MSEVPSELQSLTIEQLVSEFKEKRRNGAPDYETSDYFAELVRRFEPLLRRAWHRGAFSTEYREYAQDVFLSLFRSLPHLRSPESFPGYFRRIALSVAADHARKNTRLREEPAPAIENAVGRLDESLFTPIFIRSYLEHLPHREKSVISLCYLEDKNIGDVARDLGLTYSAVNSIKARGIKRLREMLLSDRKAVENAGKNI